MRSSVPPFKAGFLARLQADPGITGDDLIVAWGNPYPVRDTGELVIIGSTTGRKLDYTAGMTRANESYDIEVLISVTGPPQNPMDEREQRAYALADAVCESVRSWTAAGGPLVSGDWGQVNIVEVSESHDQDALLSSVREASVMLTVHVTARI